ncbi:MFS transporter [Xylophilus sp.]|uniref:MFS transporter n=1 Tax=Xylophilus sp. TaxID=2653893 RepID=UPI0013BC8444|nr:MFS transporter [Xylophilus sp.]KAF1049158.1 MAG: hypothetical protein GAK38_00926 [Xylophilus sp.]
MQLLPAKVYLATYGASGAILSALPVFLPLILLDRLAAATYASLLVMSGLVTLVLVPLLGPATDRYGSARVLIVGEGLFLGNLLFGCVLVAAARAPVAGWAVHYALSGALGALMMPARATVIQALVPEASLARYLGFESAVSVSGRLFGPTLAGAWMIAARPSDGYFAVVAVWCMLWLVHVALLRSLLKTRAGAGAARPAALAGWLREAGAGLALRWRLRTERWLTVQAGIELFAIVPAFSMNLALAVKALGWGNVWLGWLQAGCGLGLVGANLVAGRITDRWGSWRTAQAAGTACVAAMFATAAYVAGSQPWGACVAVCIANFAIGLRIFCGRAQRRVALPKEYLGRFAASHALVNALAAQLGNALAAVAFAALGAASWYVIGALAFGLAVAMTGLIPDWRILMSLPVAQARGFYGTRGAGRP